MAARMILVVYYHTRTLLLLSVAYVFGRGSVGDGARSLPGRTIRARALRGVWGAAGSPSGGRGGKRPATSHPKRGGLPLGTLPARKGPKRFVTPPIVRFSTKEEIMSDFNQAIIDEFRANGGKVGGYFAGAN